MRFFPTDTIRYASSVDVVPVAEITNTYLHAGLPIHYVLDPTEMMYVREQNDLISNWSDPAYAYHPFQDERSFEFVNWCLLNNVTQTAVDQLLKGQHSPLRGECTAINKVCPLPQNADQENGGWTRHELVDGSRD